MAEPSHDEQETLVDAYIGAVAADLRTVGIQVRDWTIEVDEHLEGYIDVGDVDPDDDTCLALAWREHLGWYLIRTKPHEALGDHWGDLDCALLAEPRAVSQSLLRKDPTLTSTAAAAWPAPGWEPPAGFDPDPPLDDEGVATEQFWAAISVYTTAARDT